jgi:hypothetical protein
MRLAIGAAGLLLVASAHAASLPRYDHIVIVVEENKDYEEIIRNKDVPFLNRLAEEGASLTHMFAEEHPSQGNYFWLFAGSNLNVGFRNAVPAEPFAAPQPRRAADREGAIVQGLFPITAGDRQHDPPRAGGPLRPQTRAVGQLLQRA